MSPPQTTSDVVQALAGQVRQLEVQVARLTAHLENEASTVTRLLADLRCDLGKLEMLLVGSDGSGLLLRQQRLDAHLSQCQEQLSRLDKEVFGSGGHLGLRAKVQRIEHLGRLLWALVGAGGTIVAGQAVAWLLGVSR